MSSTFTVTNVFTITNAEYLSSKVAADMHICSRYYGEPCEAAVRNYSDELSVLLNGEYVSKYEFGFKLNGNRVVCWCYSVSPCGGIECDDSAGKVYYGKLPEGAVYYNYLWRSQKWWDLSVPEREAVEVTLPVQRTSGSPPGDGNGYWASDKSYSSGGVCLGRTTFRPY